MDIHSKEGLLGITLAALLLTAPMLPYLPSINAEHLSGLGIQNLSINAEELDHMPDTADSTVINDQQQERDGGKVDVDLANSKKMLSKTQLPFIENLGQANEEVKFYANTFAGTVLVTEEGLVYVVSNDKEGLVIKEKFSGDINPVGMDKSNAKINYFVGEQENWRTNIPSYNTLSLGEVWSSIHVELNAYGNNVEKIFKVHPGASVDDIKLVFDGVGELEVSEDGELLLNTELGTVAMTKPVAYQDIDGMRNPVEVSYIVDGSTYGFVVGDYVSNHTLVIDPLLGSTFIGGSGSDLAHALAIDSSDKVFVAGETIDTAATDYPTTVGAFDTMHNGAVDAFVSRLSNDLSTLEASTFIGGSFNDVALALAIDSSDKVFVAGHTADAPTDYPTTVGAYDTSHNGASDAFVSRLSNDLTMLEASTLIGGSGDDRAFALAIDSSDKVFVAGQTADAVTDYPTTVGAFDTAHNGIQDVFVSRLSNNLTMLEASTFIGGSGTDVANALAIDSSDKVFVAGFTFDDVTDYPTTVGAFNTVHNGFVDAFLSRLSNDLTMLEASTFIGGSGYDQANALAIDSSDKVFVAGFTTDAPTDYPTTVGAFDTAHNGVDDAFVSRLSNDLSTLEASTLIGGDGTDQALALAIDSSDKVFVAGFTISFVIDYPTTPGAYDTTHNGSNDAFVSCFSNDLSAGLGRDCTLSRCTFDPERQPEDPISMNTVRNRDIAKTIHAEKQIFECTLEQGDIPVIVDVTIIAEIYEDMNTQSIIKRDALAITCVKQESQGVVIECESSIPDDTTVPVTDCEEESIAHPQEMNTINKGKIVKTIEAQKEVFICTLNDGTMKKVDVVLFTEIWENLSLLPNNPVIKHTFESMRCTILIDEAEVESCKFSSISN